MTELPGEPVSRAAGGEHGGGKFDVGGHCLMQSKPSP